MYSSVSGVLVHSCSVSMSSGFIAAKLHRDSYAAVSSPLSKFKCFLVTETIWVDWTQEEQATVK